MRAVWPAIQRLLTTRMRSISILIVKPRGSYCLIGGVRRQRVVPRGRVSSRRNHASYSLPQIWIESGESPTPRYSLRELLGHDGGNRFRMAKTQKGMMLLGGAAPSDDEFSTGKILVRCPREVRICDQPESITNMSPKWVKIERKK